MIEGICILKLLCIIWPTLIRIIALFFSTLIPPPFTPLSTFPFSTCLDVSPPVSKGFVNDSWEEDRALKGNIKSFTKDVIVWNKDVFGNIFHRKNRMEARLRGIQASLADGPSDYLLYLEEVLRKEYLGIL